MHTVRTRRHGESPLKMFATRIAYRIIQLGIGDRAAGRRRRLQAPLAPGRRSPAPAPRSRPVSAGLVVWLGYPQVFVPYEREARHAGRTHFPFFSRNPWKTFALGLTSFSFMPVYVVPHARRGGRDSGCRAGDHLWRDGRPARVPVGGADGRGRRGRRLRHPNLQRRAGPAALHRRIESGVRSDAAHRA